MEYVLKLDGDYYAGPSEKYSGCFMISGRGAIGAKRYSYDEAKKIQEKLVLVGYTCLIEKYEPLRYAKECLEEIIKYEVGRRRGKDPGYAIENNALECLEYLKQIKLGSDNE